MIKKILLIAVMLLLNLQTYSYASGSLGPYSSQFWFDAARGDYNKSMIAKHNDLNYLVSSVDSIFDISIGDSFNDVINAYGGSPYNERWKVGGWHPPHGSFRGEIKLNAAELDPVESGYYYTEEIDIETPIVGNTVASINIIEKYRIGGTKRGYASFDKRFNSLVEAATKVHGSPVEKKQDLVMWRKNGIHFTISGRHWVNSAGYSEIRIERSKPPANLY